MIIMSLLFYALIIQLFLKSYRKIIKILFKVKIMIKNSTINYKALLLIISGKCDVFMTKNYHYHLNFLNRDVKLHLESSQH